MGLFHTAAISIQRIYFEIWPNNVNLNEMFTNEVYYLLHELVIASVRMPKTKFQHLAGDNFTFTRRLHRLLLINCGIETIDVHTFDVIGRTLYYINLMDNRIKYINFDMFRYVYETKFHFCPFGHL